MYQISKDESKNLLMVRLEGMLTPDEARALTSTFIEYLEQLKPGMNIINDISAYKPSSREVQNEIMRAQESAIGKGVNKVIRVVGSAMGKIQYNRLLSRHSHIDFEIVEVPTYEEAIQILEK